MTYIRRLVQGKNVYLYGVRIYRDLVRKKVRQEATYLGKEFEVNGEKVVKPPVDRK